MKNVTEWMKSNPIILITLLVFVLAVGVVFYLTFSAQPEFLDSVGQRDAQLQNIKRARSGYQGVPITEAHIKERQAANASFAQAYQNLFAQPEQINQKNKSIFSPNIFPVARDIDYYTSRQNYLDQFLAMYESLEAGMPPSDNFIEAHSEYIQIRQQITIARQTIQTNLPLAGPDNRFAQNKLDAARVDLKKFYAELQQVVLKIQKQRAERIRVYGTQPRLNLGKLNDPVEQGGGWETGFFDVKQWPRTEGLPSNYIVLLWQAQMDIWIQQDIVESIRIANRITGPNAQPNLSVRVLPIKRIESIVVNPEYIGSDRAMSTRGTEQASIPLIFTDSPTGRVANRLFDVRHARVTMIVDPRGMPAILNAFSSVNFQTPIIETITNVNDTEARRNGYFYGDSSAGAETGLNLMRVTLLVESLWLRSWIAGHPSLEAAQEEFEARFLNRPETEEASAEVRQLVERYQGLTSPEEKQAFIKENYYNTGLMPNEVRQTLGIPLLDESVISSGARPRLNNE